MNRTNLYRGKRIDNGERVQGYLFCIWEKSFILWGMTNDVPNMIEVDRDTVGQFTDLTDTNKVNIFDGDIVRLVNDFRHDEYAEEWLAVVEFGNPNGFYSWGWQLRYIKGSDWFNRDILLWIDMEETGATCEVIGNIFDNPEICVNSILKDVQK